MADTVNPPKHDIAVIDDQRILRAVIEVDVSEWITDVPRGRVALPAGNDMRGMVNRYRYDAEQKSWVRYYDQNTCVTQELDWDEIRRNASADASSPPEWPKGVRPITLDGTALLGLDKDLTLYWDGKAIEVKKTVSLNLWQNVLANVAALSALAVAIVEVAAFVISLHK